MDIVEAKRPESVVGVFILLVSECQVIELKSHIIPEVKTVYNN